MTWEIDERKIPAPEDVKKLLKTAKERADASIHNHHRQPVIDYTVLLVFIYTGVRSQELCDLMIEDCDFKKGMVVVKRGKGGRYRTIAAPEKLLRHLKAFLVWKEKHGEAVTPTAPLFLSSRKVAFETRGIRHLFKRCLKNAGLSLNFGCHSLRHHHLTQVYLASGKDVVLTAQRAGHSSISTTQVYTHICQQRHREVAELL